MYCKEPESSEDQITYFGEYNKKGRKVGKWSIRWNEKGQNKQIGGGSFDEQGIKIGRWMELCEGFNSEKQVTYNGEYNQKGMKVGRWDINYCEEGKQEYKLIGGGSYGEGVNQIKIGKWVELDEGFGDGIGQNKITYNGEYNMKGMKVGRWDISYDKNDGNGQKQIGGGSYGEGDGQIKIGKWVELWENFGFLSQITYSGEYNKKGMKVGRWDINYCDWGMDQYKQIGGGSYAEGDGQIKIGKWIELDQGFERDKKVTFNGEYNMKGVKIGIWVEMDIGENKKRGEKKYKN
ncbi:unnamed protein product [Paramecium sonneborni]|uniref:MORN repeat protein n=1 Tax=Paramecium sonneborni TaxID=65129 RepID=A0A8S1QNQ3_9CILI|nr:unnamed protein product [Paramecium sonneborni]